MHSLHLTIMTFHVYFYDYYDNSLFLGLTLKSKVSSILLFICLPQPLANSC